MSSFEIETTLLLLRYMAFVVASASSELTLTRDCKLSHPFFFLPVFESVVFMPFPSLSVKFLALSLHSVLLTPLFAYSLN